MAIYYICPDRVHPVGGVRIIYRHVDILNEHGIPAYVVHNKKGFRVDWFKNNTPIVYWKNGILHRLMAKIKRRLDDDNIIELPISNGPSSNINRSDILVVPEMYGPDLASSIGRGIRKVVLNQNCYLTFRGYSFQRDRLITPYFHKDVVATLINSHDGEDYLKYAFSGIPIHRFRLSLDPNLFNLQRKKKLQVCFSRIKNEADALQVINILKFRNALDNVEIVPFINMPQNEVAQIYKDSLLFLSFGYPEGFGLPAAEAMACGCVVVGFHGGGGREFFKPEFSHPIEQGDIIGFADTVERLLKQYHTDPSSVLRMGEMAAEYIQRTYSPELESQEVMSAWRNILERVND